MKNQKTQMIVLASLIAAVLGLGVFKVMGSDKPDKAAPQKPAAAVEQNAQVESEPAQSSEVTRDTNSSDMTEISLSPESKPRDPFVPQVIDVSLQNRRASRMQPPPLVSNMPKLPLPLITPLRPEPIDFKPGRQADARPEPDPVSALRLTGVIEGSCSVAIIRGEGGARHIVREGQSIEGKFVVQSISRTGVRLKYGGKIYVLRLGTPTRKLA